MLSVTNKPTMLSVVMLNIVMPCVVATDRQVTKKCLLLNLSRCLSSPQCVKILLIQADSLIKNLILVVMRRCIKLACL